jgi:hypothetical protein
MQLETLLLNFTIYTSIWNRQSKLWSSHSYLRPMGRPTIITQS